MMRGGIDKIEELYSFEKRYQIEYSNSILKEYTTFTINDDKIASRDSIAYNQNGTIRAIYNFNTYSGEDLVLTRICEFEYSSQNRVSEKKSYSVDQANYTSIVKYFWNDENIENSKYYNEEEVLLYEVFYDYDNQINYKKDIPIYISDPVNQSSNNIISSGFNDYTGAIDLSCNSCETKYRYNRDGYPTSVKYDWGTRLSLTYE